MVKKTIILKESELVELIRDTVNNIQLEQTMLPDIFAGGGGGGLGGGHTVGGYHAASVGSGGSPEWVGEWLVAFGKWIHKTFCFGAEPADCAQNYLTAIAIIGAFIPGGQIVSIIAGLGSAAIAFSQGDTEEGAAMLVFELFPATRILKRVIQARKALKVKDIQKVTDKMMKSDFNAKVYKSLKGDEKKAADYLLKNVDNVEADVTKALKNLKNDKAVKKIMKLHNDDILVLAKTQNISASSLRAIRDLLKHQAKNIDDYARFFNTWRVVAKEVLFIGGAVTAMIVTQIAASLPKEFYLRIIGGGSERKGRLAIEEILAEENIEDLLEGTSKSPEELTNDIFNNEGTKTCIMNAFFVILIEKECSAAFVRDVLDMFRYEHDFEGTNEEVWEAWAEDSIARFEEEESSSGKSAEERWLDTIKWTMDYYIGQESQKDCWDGDQLKTELHDCVESYLST